MTGTIFRSYIEQILAPTLKADDIVVMGNLRVLPSYIQKDPSGAYH
jgi:hypothetical protein